MADIVDTPIARAAPPPWREPVDRARHALIEWLLHMVVAAGLLVGLHGFEALVHLAAGPALDSLFDAGDAGLIAGILGYGVYAVLNAYNAEGEAEADDVGEASPRGGVLSAVRLAVTPDHATMTIAAFRERLTGHLVIYTVILLAAIYLWLFVTAALAVAIASIGLMLLCGVMSVAIFAPRGSLWNKVKWIAQNRAAAGSFVVALAVLVVIEELLRRSS
jgi:hypothetical protein